MIYCYHTYVWAEKTETGERALKRVVQTFLKEKDELVHIQVGSETITCTTEHPFYVQGKGWVAAQDLKPNDKLELRDGEDAFVNAVRYEKLEKPIPVFNFEVEGFHTYYVGVGCILVHNTCSERAARRDAKRSENIPLSQKPDAVYSKWVKGADGKYAKSITEVYGNHFIRNDTGGHMFSDGTFINRHFNAGRIIEGGYVSNGKHFFY